MAIKHRVRVALNKVDLSLSYGYETFTTPDHVYFVFEDAKSAQIVRTMLRQILKRKPLIHNGRKP